MMIPENVVYVCLKIGFAFSYLISIIWDAIEEVMKL